MMSQCMKMIIVFVFLIFSLNCSLLLHYSAQWSRSNRSTKFRFVVCVSRSDYLVAAKLQIRWIPIVLSTQCNWVDYIAWCMLTVSRLWVMIQTWKYSLKYKYPPKNDLFTVIWEDVISYFHHCFWVNVTAFLTICFFVCLFVLFLDFSQSKQPVN